MARVLLDTIQITDWTSFHSTCKDVFGFPSFYGMNMNAWIDCMTYIHEGDGMSRFHLAANEKLTIKIGNSDDFRERLPEIFEALIDSIHFVNERQIEDMGAPMLVIELR